MTCNVFLVWFREWYEELFRRRRRCLRWFIHSCGDFALYVLILIGPCFCSFFIFAVPTSLDWCAYILAWDNILTPWFHVPFKCTHSHTFTFTFTFTPNWALIPIIFIINNLEQRHSSWWMDLDLEWWKRKRGSKWKNNNMNMPFTHAFALTHSCSHTYAPQFRLYEQCSWGNKKKYQIINAYNG